jgi:hypothetical protein
VKYVDNNSNPLRSSLENRLKDGVRAAEASSVGVETRTRAFGEPPKIADGRRLGHLVGLTRGKNVSCQRLSGKWVWP